MNRAAMQAGRERAARRRERQALAAVRAFRQWLLVGQHRGEPIPPVPRDSQYRLARAAGEPIDVQGVR